MKRLLYSNGDSVVWGAELESKETERFSSLIAKSLDLVDCNNASAGVSNDYIYRQTLRDVTYWLDTNKCWSEESGWVKSEEIFVLIGWTVPTRFEWWDGSGYQQERLWVGYDKWGENDKNRITNEKYVLNQTELIPSYIRTFNQILSLSSFLEKYNIPYYFFNTIYQYEFPTEPKQKMDKFGRDTNQMCLESLWKLLPNDFKSESMYDYIFRMGEFNLLPRNHPTKRGHGLWADKIIKIISND